MQQAQIIHGETLEVLRTLPDESVDAIVTDPPYGLTSLTPKKVSTALATWLGGDRSYVPTRGAGFMGNSWDRFVPPPALWDEALRVVKPGGFLACFAGARTVDLMGMSVRLAGFEMRDVLAWVRADSFPKSRHILKSGHEPILLAQKPLDGTVGENAALHGTGALNVEAVRTPFTSVADEAESKTKNAHGRFGTRHGGNEVFGDFGNEVRSDYDAPGRWPTNVLLDEAAAVQMDAANPPSRSRKGAPRAGHPGTGWGPTHTGAEYDDAGGPSRFFPKVHAEEQAGFAYAGRATSKERPVAPDGTKHPTVKPLSVMSWLTTLTTPPGGTILDPFAGSGATLEAAITGGFGCIAIEREAPFISLIEQRLARATERAA